MKRRFICMLTLPLILPVQAGAQSNFDAWSGGVGSDERETAPVEGTRFTFFAESGAYLSNVKVSIRDEDQQELLNITSGPWLVVNLPPARYWVIAEVEGRGGQSVLINLNSGQREFGLMFPGDN